MNVSKTIDTAYTEMYEALSNPRQKASLQRVKAACDYLESTGLKISTTAIESYCLSRDWDGPKAQSIRNSRDVLLRYVDLRRSGQTVEQTPKKKTAEPDIADESLRAYVRLLVQERDQAVAARKRIEAGLRSIPGVNVDDIIRSGLTGTAAQVQPPVQMLTPAMLAAVHSILDEEKLANCGLELYKDRVRQSSTKNVLLEKADVEALRALAAK